MKDIFHKTDGTEPILEHDSNKYFNYKQTK